MSYLQQQQASKSERGDRVKAVRLHGRRVTLSRSLTRRVFGSTIDGRMDQTDRRGFTLIELVITITVLTILTLGIVPLLKLSVKRQKEQQLRAALREMRTAIDEFHRDTVDMLPCTGTTATANPAPPPNPNLYVDPRSKVKISDCTIFGVDNPDKYPPDLETLVSGVNVVPRAAGLGGRSDRNVDATKVGELATKKKVYLRKISIDPMTGEAKWDLRSCYDSADSDSWGGENVFDVRSKSRDTALNGEKYSDW